MVPLQPRRRDATLAGRGRKAPMTRRRRRASKHEIRESYREFAAIDWPDTLRLAHSLTFEERVVWWWLDNISLLKRLPLKELARLRQEKLENDLRVAERARRLDPRRRRRKSPG